MQDVLTTGPMKIKTTLVKYNEGETEPFEVLEQVSWHESDGTEVTDPARIAELIAAETAGDN